MMPRSYVLTALGALLVSGALSTPVPVQADCGPDIIDTVVGGGVGDGGPALQGSLRHPWGVVSAADGSLYIGDRGHYRIRKVDPAGLITTVAGNGERGYSGDGGPAGEASLKSASCVALGVDGSLYIGDTNNERVRKVDSNGIITTVAGDGWHQAGWACRGRFAGDGGCATEASLSCPHGVAVGGDGSLYIADTDNQRIRKVDPHGVISTVAGNGQYGHFGDGGPATEASLSWPRSVALGTDGSIYIADTDNRRIRRVDPVGIITTVAGNGEYGCSGDGGPATMASLHSPMGVAVGADGSIYIADRRCHRIRRVDPAGIITTVAGNGQRGYSGDGGPATEASLNLPDEVAVGPDGSLYIADSWNHCIRKVDSAGIIGTAAGTGSPGYGGDGGPATNASLFYPTGAVMGTDDTLYIADTANQRIRKVDLAGTISTVAGDGWRHPWEPIGRYAGDGGPATQASLDNPSDLALGLDGSLYIADSRNRRIRKVDPAGIITTVAGNGERGYSGNGGPATEASLSYPAGVALGADGTLYIADEGNHRIRKVDPEGMITTVAGDGSSGYSGDGGPATAARLNAPTDVALGADGSLYIADCQNLRIRKVDAAGIITTVAGDGSWGYSGDGGPATAASLDSPHGVAVGADGSLYIADTDNHRIREVDLAGIISTLAGDGERRYVGDGGPATEASLSLPQAVAVASDGSLYIADTYNDRIRKIFPGPCCKPEYEPAVAITGEPVTFHANASAGGGMATCQWDFGDGARVGGCELTHVYSSPGEYLACVTVTNEAGASHTCCTVVTVTCECDVGLVPFWCRIPPGKVDQRRPGHIAARNWGSQPCEVVLRVRNGAGSVVFETMRTLPPFRWTRVRFVRTFTADDTGPNPWAWEVWPVECDEGTPGDNVLERPVRVIVPRP